MCNRTECCGYCVIKVKVYQSLMGCKHNRMEIYGREHRSQAPGTTKESYRGATPAKILSQDTPAMNITQTSKNNITNITHVFSSQFSYSMPSHVISKKTCKTPTVQYFSHFFWEKPLQAAKTSGGSDAGRPLDSKIRCQGQGPGMGRVVLPLEIGVVTGFDGKWLFLKR